MTKRTQKIEELKEKIVRLKEEERQLSSFMPLLVCCHIPFVIISVICCTDSSLPIFISTAFFMSMTLLITLLSSRTLNARLLVEHEAYELLYRSSFARMTKAKLFP